MDYELFTIAGCWSAVIFHEYFGFSSLWNFVVISFSSFRTVASNIEQINVRFFPMTMEEFGKMLEFFFWKILSTKIGSNQLYYLLIPKKVFVDLVNKRQNIVHIANVWELRRSGIFRWQIFSETFIWRKMSCFFDKNIFCCEFQTTRRHIMAKFNF